MSDKFSKISKQQIDEAIQAFQNGKLVAIPTETVYGLAAPIDGQELLHKIFELKERPLFDPLIVHVSEIAMAKKLVADWPKVADELCQQFWPGPLTLVLKKNDNVSSLITAGLDTVGIRMPNHPGTLELIKKLKKPLAAPSANKFKKTSPTQSSHVREFFSEDDVFILEGGVSAVGIESTILLLGDGFASVLRKGMISNLDILPVLKKHKYELIKNTESRIIAPGQVEHHYMPAIPVIFVSDLNSNWREQISHYPWAGKGVKLEIESDPFLAARNLYANLRKLSDTDASFIYWHLDQKMASDPYWEALFDRLSRASLIKF